VSKRRRRSGGLGALRNLGAGDYNPVQRVGRIGGNLLRRITKVQTCCGNYGDPGC
jgi:hypothetical protein